MTKNIEQRISRLLDRIQDSDGLSEADREVLLEFDDQLALRSSEYSDQRREHLVRRCTIMAEGEGGLRDALSDREAAEDLVRWIHANYDNEESNRDYRGSLRVFARMMTDGDEIPDSVSWVSGSTSRNYKPSPKPADMLHWEDDVLPMIDAARYSRDEAMIAVAWDSGARSGEFRDLRVGDIADHKRGYKISVDGKTGQRSITLIPSVPYLQRWLADHPAPDDPDAPLWSHLHEPEGLKYHMFQKTLQNAAEEAGVQKPVTLTNYRKSSASYLASQGVNQAVLEEHHGWARGSRVASRYVSVFADATDREIAAAHGEEIDEADRPSPTAPMQCPRCGEPTPQSKTRCMHCRHSLDVELETLVDKLSRRIDELTAEADDSEARGDLITARRHVEQSASQMSVEELHDLASSFSDND